MLLNVSGYHKSFISTYIYKSIYFFPPLCFGGWGQWVEGVTVQGLQNTWQRKANVIKRSDGKMLHQSAQTWNYWCIWGECVIQSVWKKTHNFPRIYSTNFQHSYGSQAEKQITETQGNQNFFSPQVNPSHSSDENSWHWRNILRNLTTMISSQGKKQQPCCQWKKPIFFHYVSDIV